MKKLLIVALSVIAVASVTFAGEAKKPLTDAEKAAIKEKRLQKTGGIVMQEGKGKLLIVNAQQKFPAESIEKTIAPYRDFLKVNMEVRPGTWKMGDKNPADANIVVYIVDDAALPMSLVAMEAHWGVMNIAPLGDNPLRFERELQRVAIATFGAGVSQYKASPMQPVSSPEDLDSIVTKGLTVDATTSMLGNLQKLGVTRTKMTTYRKACQEGWAASPTNDYQKAIWNELHEIPTAPMVIKPEKHPAK